MLERPPVTEKTLIATIAIGFIAVGIELFILFRYPTSTINWIALLMSTGGRPDLWVHAKITNYGCSIAPHQARAP